MKHEEIRHPSTLGHEEVCKFPSINPLQLKTVHSPSDHSEASRIRLKYLRALGVEAKHKRNLSAALSRRETREVAETSRLKCGEDEKGTQQRVVRPRKLHNALSRVAFDTKVAVHIIPSRHELSDRVKKTIWTSHDEFQVSVTRNVIEYMAEGFEPSGVLEESDFIRNGSELLHPVHLLLNDLPETQLKHAYYQGYRELQP